MRLLLYSGRNDQENKRLVAAVREAIPEKQIELYHKLDDFEQRLRTLIEPDSIAVLSAPNLDALREMQRLRELLKEIYVVLVIPDRKKSTIELAHLLLPRFLSGKKDDFADLKIVLNKMYINSQHSPDGGMIPGQKGSIGPSKPR